MVSARPELADVKIGHGGIDELVPRVEQLPTFLWQAGMWDVGLPAQP